MKYTREQAEAVLNDWFECPSILAEDFLNEKFKPQIEVGKWYKNETGISLLILEATEDNSYVVSVSFKGLWHGREAWIGCDNLTPMTEDEVFEMLKKEAIKRGYKDGNYKCLQDPEETFKLGDDFKYKVSHFGNLLITTSEYSMFSSGDYNKIFDYKTGEWAQIICPIDEEIKELEQKIENLKRVKCK